MALARDRTALVAAVEAAVRSDGAQLLSVKTLGPSRPSYGHTRRFYLARGFLPLEELRNLWEDNPCLTTASSSGP